MKTHKQRVFTNPLTLAEKEPPRIGGGEAGGLPGTMSQVALDRGTLASIPFNLNTHLVTALWSTSASH